MLLFFTALLSDILAMIMQKFFSKRAPALLLVIDRSLSDSVDEKTSTTRKRKIAECDSKPDMHRMVKKFDCLENTTSFGSTLTEFGYAFNQEGELRDINTGGRFVFHVKPDDRAFNQAHYEAIGEVIDDEVFKLLERECKLKRIEIPVDAAPTDPRGFFFASENAWTNDRLMLLIHGSGVVKAGQWSRRLIINENLESGTQIPYIKRAMVEGYGVVVLNTNQNKAKNGQRSTSFIKGSEDAQSHALYVWDHFIERAKAQLIAIVAHSAGGYVTVRMAVDRPNQFSNRVFAVAFTDSVHFSAPYSPVWQHLVKVSRNWVSSNKPLDTSFNGKVDEIKCVSAGTTVHEVTSHSAIDSIFKFLEQRLAEFQHKVSRATED